MKETKQGEMLKACLEKIVEPNKVKLESLNEDEAEGRSKIGLYFNYRKYLLWRSRSEVTQLSLNTSLLGGYDGDSDDDTDE